MARPQIAIDPLNIWDTLDYWNRPGFEHNMYVAIHSCKKGNLHMQGVVIFLSRDIAETVCFYHAKWAFRVNPHSIVAWMSRNALLAAGAKSEV